MKRRKIFLLRTQVRDKKKRCARTILKKGLNMILGHLTPGRLK